MRNCNTVIILFTEEYWDLLQTLNLEAQSQSVYLSRSLLLFYSHLIFQHFKRFFCKAALQMKHMKRTN